MPDTLTLNKITTQRGISISEATRRIADLGWDAELRPAGDDLPPPTTRSRNHRATR